MSAFIVCDTTINGFVTKIATDRDIRPPAQRALSRIPKPYDLGHPDDVDRLAFDCFRLNMMGVDSRYGDGESVKFRELNFKPRQLIVSRVQAYKSLSCFLYQCAEGDVPTMPLFKALQRIKAHIAEAVVSRLPDYEKAVWG
jgi:hypothetical protein